MLGRATLVIACVAMTAGTAEAQDPYNLTAPVPNLATMFANLFGPHGLVVDPVTRLLHLNN